MNTLPKTATDLIAALKWNPHTGGNGQPRISALNMNDGRFILKYAGGRGSGAVLLELDHHLTDDDMPSVMKIAAPYFKW